ncbi:H-NS histone family protein [Mesorhizobium sp. M0618]|uniref:H-NS histone family protein n=1 Tax=Mesorhizobium sp. M0618 TaxID=2956972 RepID=UPI00333DE4CD
MSDHASEAPAALTPRLVFDDTEIPTFLLKDHERKKIKDAVEDHAGNRAIVEPETVATPPIGDPIDESFELPEEAAVTVEAPTQELEEVVTRDEDPGSHSGPDDLNDLSIEDLQRQQQEIDRKIQEKREAEKQSVIEQIVQVVNTYKIPIDELVEKLGGLKIKRKGVKATPKYKDPVSGAIWTGRGKEPAWIKGKDRKPFLIR